jgi:hypothetical protein
MRILWLRSMARQGYHVVRHLLTVLDPRVERADRLQLSDVSGGTSSRDAQSGNSFGAHSYFP